MQVVNKWQRVLLRTTNFRQKKKCVPRILSLNLDQNIIFAIEKIDTHRTKKKKIGEIPVYSINSVDKEKKNGRKNERNSSGMRNVHIFSTGERRRQNVSALFFSFRPRAYFLWNFVYIGRVSISQNKIATKIPNNKRLGKQYQRKSGLSGSLFFLSSPSSSSSFFFFCFLCRNRHNMVLFVLWS